MLEKPQNTVLYNTERPKTTAAFGMERPFTMEVSGPLCGEVGNYNESGCPGPESKAQAK